MKDLAIRDMARLQSSPLDIFENGLLRIQRTSFLHQLGRK
jgi:hypothetical protein